jgi:hypothetical protein
LVLAAGVAQADITWSGSATAGLARDGKVKSTAAATSASNAGTIVGTATQKAYVLISAVKHATGTDGVVASASDTAPTADEIATARASIAAAVAAAKAGTSAGVAADAATIKAAAQATAALDTLFGKAATTTGKMKQYSEVNATASASVATDMGWTVSAAISVDAGTGYDFADDDTFDGAKTNGVGLDSVSIDFGAGGKLTLDQDAVAHLVDADDDEAADLLYTNTFGAASVSIAADIDDGDSDVKARSASFVDIADNKALSTVNGAFMTKSDSGGSNGSDVVAYDAGAAADVQWSAKVSMPLAGTNVYFAADEEGGDAYGVSGTYAGIGWSVDSKREAAEKDANKDRSNTVGLTYATGALTLGATYNSIKDGDQWGVSAAYAAGALSLNVSTDEGSDWSASGAYDLGNGASLVGGTNYTEDAYVGVSFAF